MEIKDVKRYSPEQKAHIIREIMVEHKSVGDVAEEFGITPATIYEWQKILLKNSVDFFRMKSSERRKYNQQVKALQDQIKKKESVIAELAQEVVELKKKENGAS